MANLLRPRLENLNSSTVPKDMSFWDHLGELRSRVIKSVICLFIATAICFHFWKNIWSWMVLPLTSQNLKVQFIALTPLEAFVASFKISLLGGVFLSLPIILWQMWRFVAPALYTHERRLFIPAFVSSIFMFLVGTAFCFWIVMPSGLHFLATYSNGLIEQNWKQTEYIGFVTKFLLAFGFVFQLPVATFVLSKLNLVTPRSMWRFSKYAVIVNFLIAAFLTPGPDPISQIMLALPLCLLYFASIGICWLTQRKTVKVEDDV